MYILYSLWIERCQSINILKLQINPRKNIINITNNNHNQTRCFNYFVHPLQVGRWPYHSYMSPMRPCSSVTGSCIRQHLHIYNLSIAHTSYIHSQCAHIHNLAQLSTWRACYWLSLPSHDATVHIHARISYARIRGCLRLHHGYLCLKWCACVCVKCTKDSKIREKRQNNDKKGARVRVSFLVTTAGGLPTTPWHHKLRPSFLMPVLVVSRLRI